MKVEELRCYVCNAPATSTEHTPPKSFFAGVADKKLITVPSCAKHNEGNSADVEYVRNILATNFSINVSSAKEANAKTWKSFAKHPALLDKTFKNFQPVRINGAETGKFNLDHARFKSVMSSIAGGIYFHLHKTPYIGSWDVFTPQTFTDAELTTGKASEWQYLRDLFLQAPFESIKMPHEEVFSLSRIDDGNHKLVFKFTFFCGFDVYAMGVPPWQRRPFKHEHTYVT